MRNFIAAAIVALVPAAPAFASDAGQLDGFGSLAAGYTSLKQTDSSKIGGLDLEGRFTVALPVAGNIGVQADGVVARTVYSLSDCKGCSTLKVNDTAFTLHGFVRSAPPPRPTTTRAIPTMPSAPKASCLPASSRLMSRRPGTRPIRSTTIRTP